MEIISSIQNVLAPLFLTNGIALFNLVQQNRYARTSDSLTAMFEKQWTEKESPEMIYLEKRIFYIRTSMFFVYLSILFALLTSFIVLPFSTIHTDIFSKSIYYITITLFSLSLIAFLVAVLIAIMEVRLSYFYFKTKIEHYKNLANKNN
jgi:hypothetical protein